MNLKEIIETEKKYIINTYNRSPVVFVKGKGVYLYDLSGSKYLDFLSGIAVTSLGHCYPKVATQLKTQAKKLIHTSNLFYTIPQIRLAELLFKLTDMRSFFCNSGAEANEAAIKLARKWGKLQGGRYEIITENNSFHGRTLTTITATGQEKYQKDFEPLTPGFKYVPFNDLIAIENSVSDKTVAIMLEVIQGESGVNIHTIDFITGIRKLCDEKKILLILDEIQTGLGRCGKLFAYQLYNIKPDIITLAKSIAQGLPMGIMLTKPEIADVFKPGDHASTFGGGPVVSKVALSVINIILKEKLHKNAEIMGDYFIEKLEELKLKYSIIKEVRGKGLMIGLELHNNIAKDIAKMCLENYLLINAIGDNIIRFLPPLTVHKKNINNAIKILENVFESCR